MLKMCSQNGKKNMEYEIIISETCIEEIDENIFFKKVFFYCKKRT